MVGILVGMMMEKKLPSKESLIILASKTQTAVFFVPVIFVLVCLKCMRVCVIVTAFAFA